MWLLTITLQARNTTGTTPRRSTDVGIGLRSQSRDCEVCVCEQKAQTSTRLYPRFQSLMRRFTTAVPLRARPPVRVRNFTTPPPASSSIPRPPSSELQPPQAPPITESGEDGSERGIPPPKRPNKMVEVSRKPTGWRGLVSRLFKTENVAERAAKKFRQEKLANIGLNKQVKFLNTDHVTNVLYWYCIDLSFLKDDFRRLLPEPSLRAGSYDHKFDDLPFQMTRARNPVNMTKWMGYFLTFESKDAAMVYYQETLGSELAGMPLKLRFVDQTIRGLESPLLQKVPNLSRKSHALILGLPVGYSETTILRVLWDYDLIDDDTLAVERLPVDKVKYGGSPYLLRFKNEEEAERFVKDYNKEIFPYTDARVFCEVID